MTVFRMLRFTSLIFLTGAAFHPLKAAPPSFLFEIEPILSRAGCNMGGCHGNASGKGGFKLSLRGENPDADYQALTSQHAARRINPFQPGQSLILLKATQAVPHEGGKRFSAESRAYQILAEWIRAGMPKDDAQHPKLESLMVSPESKVLRENESSVDFKVQAVFSDGEKKDVTHLATLEASNTSATIQNGTTAKLPNFGETNILVRYSDQQLPIPVVRIPARKDFSWNAPKEANYIDKFIHQKLRKLRLNPSPPASDRIFLRRVYLDLLGIPPTPKELQSFLDNSDPEKRSKVAWQLMERQEFAEFWGLKWADILRNQERKLDKKGVRFFHKWIVEQVRLNLPLDKFVEELLTAEGSTYDNPPTNYWRVLREPETRAETTAQIFLGTRLQCAKCHNHPFDQWTQADYYGWGTLFSRVRFKIIENKPSDKRDKREFVGEQVVWFDCKGKLRNPSTNRDAPPVYLQAGKTPQSHEDFVLGMADWITSKHNPRFAKAQANRIWFHLMGRGLVDPVDDLRTTNPASHPELLEALTNDLCNNNFDQRQLIARIIASEAYQRSSIPSKQNAADTLNYAYTQPRRLTAEQYLDSLSQALGKAPTFKDEPAGTRAAQVPGVAILSDRRPQLSGQFLKTFGKPSRTLPTECERSNTPTLGQTFQLLSGPLLHSLLSDSTNAISVLAKSSDPNTQKLQQLYLRTLCRLPTENESQHLIPKLDQSQDPTATLQDITWALLNSKEFLLRH